jgi:hypothetical protein
VIDLMALLFIVLGFALLLTAHVVLAVNFAIARLWRRALVGFLVPPIAPVLAFHAGARLWPIVWIAAAGVYIIGMTAAAGNLP